MAVALIDRRPLAIGMSAGSSIDGLEAGWIEFMTGFRILPKSCEVCGAGAVGDSIPSVFYVSPFSVLQRQPGESAFPWMEVNGERGTVRHLLGVDSSEAPPRSLWFNVALLCLLLRGGLLIHSAGAEISGKGFLFLGESGIGKSTFSGLLEEYLPESVVCDERVSCRPVEGGWIMSGTPWFSSAEISRRRTAPLAGLVFLEQSKKNNIRQITSAEALPRMLPLISVDWQNKELSDRGINALDDLLSSVPAFNFSFQKSSSAAEYFAEWVNTSENLLC